MSSHPRVYARGRTPSPRFEVRERARVLVYGQAAQPWIEEELAQQHVIVQVARTVGDLVSALVEDPPPRPQFLVADFDAMTPGELLHIHTIREQGWFGCIVALGNLPATLRDSMGIERVIAPPYPRDALSGLISVGSQEVVDTVRLTKKLTVADL